MSQTCTWLEFVLRLTVLKKLVSAPGLWSPATFEVMATNFMVARMRVQGDHAAQMYQVCGSWVHVGAPGDGAGHYITLHYKIVTRTATPSNQRATSKYGHGEPDVLGG